MDDQSRDALRDRGAEQEDRMRVFLGCQKPSKGVKAYDFRKGKVHFEYKYSSVHLSNQNLEKRWRSAPTKRWVSPEIWGDGGNKRFDYLILEGNGPDPTCSYYFLIGAKEVRDTGKQTFYVTVPMSAKTARCMRGVSRFVWDRERNKDDLKSEVGRLALAFEGAGCSAAAGISGELDSTDGSGNG